ncbi:Gfo/Idh/MocA family oxidoreductase [Paenibacillus sp. KACC 21273]|uniref:Gfo/Idh/MocA family protein n=1 Tax=Paenibacillus sp. KACC 21273 TaxID=3025665 RepID=UPI002366CCE6|nr:Gfo/Idh/MocA family oxidoreductase [Paenibacillus sp. KACC 21273]WDF51170.1 Gfo/Idh/MocA family oxidoreductase [Paenibacillus sp. KACC 21273]
MIKVAILSYWHVHAQDYTNDTLNHPDTEVVAVWDEIPERGQKKAEELGVPFYEDLHELFANPDIDGVVITTPTVMHRDVMIHASEAGKHIFTEKVIAPTNDEVEQIIEAVNKHNVTLTVSLPRLNAGYTLAIQQLLADKVLGELTLVRTRLSHDGATQGWLPDHFFGKQECGGGALIDLGCHPVYLARLFMGMPESVSANYGYVTGKEVEDNAVTTFRYSNGGVGIVEAGFVNKFSPFVIEVHGTLGSVLYSTHDEKLWLRAGDDTAWQEVTIPADRETAFEQWVAHIQNGTKATENIGLAVDLTRLVQASNQSAAEDRPVSL